MDGCSRCVGQRRQITQRSGRQWSAQAVDGYSQLLQQSSIRNEKNEGEQMIQSSGYNCPLFFLKLHKAQKTFDPC